ncbi:MAG: patatin-like phospholipase family protein, partial [Opitutales bacterium]|nr:patatin-like phospholipase family protein [Opitutales bacterium]
MQNIALVLEGGGMRGVFTAGILDSFLKHEIFFNYVVATSAGTSNGLSYASRQMGRAHYCNIETLRKYNYIGVKFLLSQRCIMDYKYLYGYLPLVEKPFDFQSYLKSGRFVLTTTSCQTGEAVYFDTPQTEDLLLDVCKASCSMPLFCPYLGFSYLRRRRMSHSFQRCQALLRGQLFRLTWKFPNRTKY